MLAAALLAVGFLYVIWKVFFDGAVDRVDQLPGPLRLPFIGCTLSFFGISQEEMSIKLRSMVREYGDRFLIKIMTRRIIHLSHPDDIEIVLSHTKNISKGFLYSYLQPWLGSGLLLSTGSKWHRRRKILTPTFHFNVLKSFSTIIEEKSRDLVTRLEELVTGLEEEAGDKSRDLVTRLEEDVEVEDEEAGDGVTINVTSVISDFTLYTICETAMGTRLDKDISKKSVEYKRAILNIGTETLRRLTNIWLRNNFIFGFSKSGKKFNDALEKVHSFADNVIIDRRKARSGTSQVELSAADEDLGRKKRLAMMDLLLDAESKGEIDLEGIREEVNTFMFEGHDTTAMALSFGLMLLADHEEVQNKIYEEQQRIFGDSDRTPAMTDLAEMKYLEAAIKETLRLYPSVPFIARTVTEDFMLGDLQVRKGHEIAVHIFYLHRRSELFPDPEEFKPERFLDGGPKHPYAYVPFSAGPRNCIGQKFAMQEMKCALSEISRSFRLTPVLPGARPTLLTDMVLRSAEPISVKFSKR